MHNTLEVRNRRVDQFAELLAKMHDRAHREAEGASYIRFDESDTDSDPRQSDLATTRTAAAQLAGAFSTSLDTSDLSWGMDIDQSTAHLDLFIDDSWQSSYRGCPRFVQFAALEFTLQIDIPKSVLFRAESQRLFRDRRSFFYLHERPQYVTSKNEIERFDPVLKFYIYGDERSAAEDMAYIFFDLWRFPVDSQLYVFAFGQGLTWENGLAIR